MSEEKPAAAAARNVFNISVSASATGVFAAPSSSAAGPSKPPSSSSLPESTLEAQLRALAFEASERRQGGGEKGVEAEEGREEIERQVLAKPRGGGWQMAL